MTLRQGWRAQRAYNIIAAAALFCVIATGKTVVAAQAQYEGVVHYVNNYGGAGECCSGCSDLSYTDNDAGYVLLGLEDAAYDQLAGWGNTDVDGIDWTNGTTDGTQDEYDNTGTDFADVVFYSGHGIHYCSGSNYSSEITSGDSSMGAGTCSPNTATHMVFGDSGGDANLLIFAACQSAHYCVWDALGYNSIMNGSANIMNGFHGNSYDSASNTTSIWNYVYSSKTEGLGDNWLDYLEADPIFDDDQCPTSVLYGTSSTTRELQYYHGGLKDFQDTGSQTGTGIYFECECDPDDGAVLPSC